MKKLTKLMIPFLLIGMNFQAYANEKEVDHVKVRVCNEINPCLFLDKLESETDLKRRQYESHYDFQTRVLADKYGVGERFIDESSEEYRERALERFDNYNHFR